MVLSMTCLPATASDADGDKRALAKAKFLLKSLQKENQSLKMERATLNKDLAAASADLDALRADKKDLEKRLSESMSENERLTSRLGTSEHRRELAYERIELLTAKLKEHIEVLKRTITNRNVLELDVEQLTNTVQNCEFKNRKLYEANLEMADRYQAKGTSDAWLQREPVTGLKQAKIEGILEEYRRKLEELKVAERSDEMQ